MTKLSVNINKVATIRNARGGNNPNLVQVAIDCEHYGAQGITVHPRPDERHITYQDCIDLKEVVKTEFNIEGNPDERFIQLVKEVKPHQVTLVPDAPNAITSNAGWDTIKMSDHLSYLVDEFKSIGSRVSIFVDSKPEMVEGAFNVGADRVELYTEPYAVDYLKSPSESIRSFVEAANTAKKFGLGLNAGHDLSLENLTFFHQHIPNLLEVSIGHALICDALYFGLENTIQMYLNCLNKG